MKMKDRLARQRRIFSGSNEAPPPLFLDTETYSEIPIAHGAHRYAEKAEIMLVSYAFGEEGPRVWDVTADPEMPSELESALDNSDQLIVMHNGGGFDRIVMRHAWGVDIPVCRIHDTMVQALAHGLPGNLDKLGDLLHLSEEDRKDKNGKRLINLFCSPRPKSMKLRRATRETHPKEWQEFINYALKDIIAMRAIYKIIPHWNYQGNEKALWELDQLINDRGMRIDIDLAEKAVATVERMHETMTYRTKEITGDEVGSTSQRDKLLEYILKEHSITLPDLQSSTLERRANDTSLPPAVRELLAIRLQASKASTSKYKALLNMVSSDGVLRGTTQFCGASRTGRWAGRGFQIQNLPSKNLPSSKEVEEGIRIIKEDAADLVYENPMQMISAAVRGCIIARPDKKLFISDLSNIEGRVAAWITGEDWKVRAFRDLDNGTGADLYRLAYAKSFRIDISEVDGGKDKGPQRQIGKVQELALQYEGGVGAFLTFSLVYNIDLDNLAKEAWHAIPKNILQEALGAWEWAVKTERTFGLVKETYMVCDALKRLWRNAHPAISSYWSQLEDAARKAINSPNTLIHARKVKFQRTNAWLRMILPSGRSVCYPTPKIDDKGKISYLGVNPYTHQWQRISTYGGKFFENLCQAVARDVMANNMQAMEDSGYQILGTVHDEVITEALSGKSFNAEELSTLLAQNPTWATDLPLAAGGFESYRYKKD